MTFRIYFIGWYLYVIILSFDHTVDIKNFLGPPMQRNCFNLQFVKCYHFGNRLMKSDNVKTKIIVFVQKTVRRPKMNETFIFYKVYIFHTTTNAVSSLEL